MCSPLLSILRDGKRAFACRACMSMVLLALVAQSLTAASPAQVPSSASPAAPLAVPAYRQANRVAVLTVRGVIDSITLKSLERRMRQAVKDGADAVVLDISTPGGEMFATLEICNLLRDRRDTPANVTAWINPTAYSAGTIISLACREIVVAPGATFGDAAPIQINPLSGLQPIPPTERAKMLAPILTEVLDSARRNHYDEGLVQAFVRLGDGLWMLENTQTGERAFVGREEYRAIFGSDPPVAVAGQPIPPAPPAALAATQPIRALVRPSFDGSIPSAADAAGLSVSQQQQHEAFRQALPGARGPLTAADAPQWRLVRQVIDDQSLLTLRANEALYYGMASAVIANDAELQQYFGAGSVRRYDESWSEGMVRFLVSLPVRAVLIIVFLICLFIELAAPGVGIFGTVAAIALLVLIGAPALAGMAQWWEVLLIVVGLALVFAELLLIPGTGIAGIVGVICLLVGLVATFVSGDLSSEEGQTQMWTGLVTTLTSIFIAGVGMWIISRQIHSFPIINRLILHESLHNEIGGTGGPATASTGLLAAMAPSRESELAVGETGAAETDLRPSGRANFRGRLINVQSNGSYIPRGSVVRITSISRFVIEVEEANA
jgi:membrane-bound serine protease (ClpP class)